MYCSTCGAAAANNLIYCKQCGAKLSGTKDDLDKGSEISPYMLIPAIVILFVFGMAAIFALVSLAKKLDFNVGLLNALVAFSFALLLALEGLFVWLLLRGRKAFEKESDEPKQLHEQARNELYEAPARVYTEPVSSVVEPTTNRLEPIPREQKSKRN